MMSLTISQRANDVRSRSRQGKPGQWVESGSTDEYRSGINSSPQVVSVYTIVVDTATNSATYTWTIGEVGNQVELTYVADASTSKIEIAAGIVAAIDASQIARGQCSAASDGVDTVTVTGLTPGLEIVASDSDAKLTSAQVTAAVSAAVIPFGRLLISQGYQSGEGEELVALAKSSLLTAQVQTITVTFVASNLLVCKVYKVIGNERVLIGQGTTVAATDLDTTLDALATAVNADLPANSVLAASDPATATQMVFTAEVVGLEFDVEITRDGGGASAPTIAKTNTTGPSVSTSINRALAGLSLFTHTESAPSGSSTGEYAANTSVLFARNGKLYVESDEAITAGAPVYIELGVTADNGQLFAASSSTRLQLDRTRVVWDRDGITSDDSIAVVRLAL